MIKSLTILLILTIFTSAFNIRDDLIQIIDKNESNFEGIPWPFTTCQDGADWKI